MDLFSLAKIKSSPELDLMIHIKYGDPRPTDEYIGSLPKIVFDRILDHVQDTYPNAQFWRDDDVEFFVRTKLERSDNTISELIKDSLLKYHTMLGHV